MPGVIALVQFKGEPDWTTLDLINNPTAWTSLHNNARISAINVQGIIWEGWGDYAIEAGPDESIIVSAFTANAGQKWTMYPISFDDSLGGAINTDQVKQEWATGFPVPTIKVLKGDAVTPAQQASRKALGWRNFCQHLPPEEWEVQPNGWPQLKDQRPQGRYLPNEGTRTYYLTDDARAHNGTTASNERALELTEDSGTLEAESIAALSAEQAWSWILATQTLWHQMEPGQPRWPDGNYRCQLDVSSAGSDLLYGWRDASVGISSAQGGMQRVDTSHSQLEEQEQGEAQFSGTGLKLGTTGATTWTSGARDDLVAVRLAVENNNVINAQGISLRFDADAFLDGPWLVKQTFADLKMQGVGY